MRVRGLSLPPLAAWPPLLALGVIGLTVYHLCLNYAETRIASGTAAIIIALSPATTGAASALWLHERLSARAVAGLAVALVGVVLVVLTSGKTMSFQPRAALVLVSVLTLSLIHISGGMIEASGGDSGARITSRCVPRRYKACLLYTSRCV